MTTYTRINGKAIELRDSIVDTVIGYVAANPGKTVDDIAMATEVSHYRVSAILECTPGGQELVKAYSVCPPPRGIAPGWVQLVDDVKLLPTSDSISNRSTTALALIGQSALPATITAEYIRDDLLDVEQRIRSIIPSRMSPKKQKKRFNEIMETVVSVAEREQETHNRLAVVSEELARELRESKTERRQNNETIAALAGLVGKKGKGGKALATT